MAALCIMRSASIDSVADMISSKLFQRSTGAWRVTNTAHGPAGRRQLRLHWDTRHQLDGCAEDDPRAGSLFAGQQPVRGQVVIAPPEAGLAPSYTLVRIQGPHPGIELEAAGLARIELGLRGVEEHVVMTRSRIVRGAEPHQLAE